MVRPVRTRPQTLQERLIPCAQFEALEAHCQAWRERSVDSDKLTVDDDDDDDDAEDVETLKGNWLSSRQEFARTQWTCSRESFSSAKERR